MSEETSKKTDVLPFETAMGFTALPTAVCQFYVRHPRFNANAERMYRYLLQRYNGAFGYAWPSYSVIRRETGIGSDTTISKALDALEYLGLIERHEHKNAQGWSNNYYTFRAPIEDEAEFERRFAGELRKK